MFLCRQKKTDKHTHTHTSNLETREIVTEERMFGCTRAAEQKQGKIATYGGKAGDVSDYKPGSDGVSGGIAEKAVISTLKGHENENKPHLTCAKRNLKLWEMVNRQDKGTVQKWRKHRKVTWLVTLPTSCFSTQPLLSKSMKLVWLPGPNADKETQKQRKGLMCWTQCWV